MDPDNIPEADWYCRNCAPPLQQQQEHAVQISDRIWKRLLNQARKANARAFSIHCSFQSQIYFNSDAEQHSSGSAKKLIGGSDTTGSLVKSDEEKALHALCHECTKHFPENQLLKCSYCNLHWHMDCLNPPMSSKNFTTWKCPLHVNNYIVSDDEFSLVYVCFYSNRATLGLFSLTKEKEPIAFTLTMIQVVELKLPLSKIIIPSLTMKMKMYKLF